MTFIPIFCNKASFGTTLQIESQPYTGLTTLFHRKLISVTHTHTHDLLEKSDTEGSSPSSPMQAQAPAHSRALRRDPTKGPHTNGYKVRPIISQLTDESVMRG